MIRAGNEENRIGEGKNRETVVRVTFIETKFILALVILLLLSACAGIGWYVMKTHTVSTVYVEGNVHYTKEQIEEMVMTGVLGDNSLYLSMKYKNRSIKGVPFVDQMDVKVLAPDTIKITVYEKALAGYVKYMNTYSYFDKDGYVVENSSIRTAGIPQVTGIDFDYIVLGQPLPVKEEQEKVFGTVLNLTKLLNKYELTADKILFHSDAQVTVYFGNVKVALGNDTDRMEDKVMLLPEFLPKLAGKSGTLQMENYDTDGGKYTFKPE